jgi:hypothetical protein
MRVQLRSTALAAAAFAAGWILVSVLAPTPSEAAHRHAHAPDQPPVMTDEEFQAMIARERPWLLPLRNERLGWILNVSQPRTETERLWGAARPLEQLDGERRDAVLDELGRKLEGARLRWERESGDPVRRSEAPDALLWSLEASYAQARLQLDEFSAGRARVLAMDTLPLQLGEHAHDGPYLSEHLSDTLRQLVVVRVDPTEEAHLHQLMSAIRRTLTAR